MPIRDFRCADCGAEQERIYQQVRTHTAVTNYAVVADEQTDPVYPPCATCGGTLTVLPLSQPSRRYVGSVFPFTTNHIDPLGKPMTIESMGHLRSVEKQYGVVLSAFSKANVNDISPIADLPRYRGQDDDFKRDRRR